MDHLFVTLHDYKSYEAVDFGKLDTFYTTIEKDSLYSVNKEMLDDQLKNAKEANDNASSYSGISYFRNTARGVS